MGDNYFKKLYDVDVREKQKTKNGLTYISWATAWAEVKKLFPDAQYTVYEDVINNCTQMEDGSYFTNRKICRPWFDDGSTGWVKVGVTINGLEHIERLPIMDFKNKSIAADKITSADANKSIQRALCKGCARHGLGLYVYEGEDLPEEAKESMNLTNDIMELISKKSALSKATGVKVGEVCKEILPEENGDPRICEDVEKLKTLKKKLMAIRKIAD